MQSRVYETVRCPTVCPPVCHIVGPPQQTRCYRFAAVGPAGRRYRSIAAAAVCVRLENAGSATLSVYVGDRLSPVFALPGWYTTVQH